MRGFCTSTSTVWLSSAWPAPEAAGERTVIEAPSASRLTTSFAGTATPSKPSPWAKPKKTRALDSNPWPLIVTWVPPALGPLVGSTEKIAGWLSGPPPWV